MEIGNQVDSDTSFTKKYRLIQSEYRANVLKQPYGKGPARNSDNEYGNMLVNGEVTGANFISESAFRFAQQKVLDKQVNKNLTIEEYRLFNNMLSSMPMCFNLFSDLRSLLIGNEEIVSKVIAAMFKELAWIHKVTFIDVEFIPVPISDYTNDKSAFDAMILVEDSKGKKGLISVETKYTDLLGSNSSSNVETKNQLISNHKIFSTHLVNELKTKGYQQIHRNYLLTYTYAKKNNFKYFANVVVSPKEDELSLKEIQKLQSELLKKQESIFKISLEDIVDRAVSCEVEEITSIMEKFERRYFGKVS
ncbi:PGN_0703 family putative restriction endonuclease [Wenyingzhuangia sp. IMCC45574]